MSEENEVIENNEVVTGGGDEIEQLGGQQEQEQDQGQQQENQDQEQQQEGQAELTPNAVKAINKKHYQLKEQERKNEELQKQLDQFKAQQAPQEIVIPEVPAWEDEDYEQKMAERDAIITQKAAQDSQIAIAQNQQYQTQQQAQYQEQVELSELSKTVAEKAKKSGVTEQQLNESINTIGQYNLGLDFAKEIMKEESSTEIIQYLSNDPLELDKISRMTDYQKGAYMSTIKTNAAALKPRSSNTPAPGGDIKGKGADPEAGKYPHSKGAKIW